MNTGIDPMLISKSSVMLQSLYLDTNVSSANNSSANSSSANNSSVMPMGTINDITQIIAPDATPGNGGFDLYTQFDPVPPVDTTTTTSTGFRFPFKMTPQNIMISTGVICLFIFATHK